MKKLTIFVLTAFVLASVFAGCSAQAYMDDPYTGGYSNVSTTRNGTVNGTNGRYGGYGYETYPGVYSGNSASGTARSGAAGRTATGAYSGTGMTGGR